MLVYTYWLCNTCLIFTENDHCIVVKTYEFIESFLASVCTKCFIITPNNCPLRPVLPSLGQGFHHENPPLVAFRLSVTYCIALLLIHLSLISHRSAWCRAQSPNTAFCNLSFRDDRYVPLLPGSSPGV